MSRSAAPLLAVAAALVLTACHDVDTKRIPLMPVRIPFATVGDWHTYGVGGAAMAVSFIRVNGGTHGTPAGYPYTGLTATGFGGVLLVGTFTYSGDPLLTPPAAFDLACPVEARADIRIAPDYKESCARCSTCGSTYDIFQATGMPLSGPAAKLGYGLKSYRVAAGGSSGYLLITY